MSAINSIIDRAYKRFVPTEVDFSTVDKAATYIQKYVSDMIGLRRIDARAVFGGSYAKSTWVKGESDIDLFVVFKSESDIKKLKGLVPKNFSEARGTRRYFRGKVNGIVTEVVPLLAFSDKGLVENSVDFSILHAEYINAKLNDALRKDVILLKQFCKANGCYGSETYVHGFSGYALELLIIKYGGIKELFEEVQKWVPGLEIIQGNGGKRPNVAVGTEKPVLFLSDPTNPKRNICASLSKENFSKFVFAVKSFLLEPKSEFFNSVDKEKALMARAKSRGTILFVNKTRVIEPRDRFLSKYNKNLVKLVQDLRSMEINVYSSDVAYQERFAVLFLEIKSHPLSKSVQKEGPTVWIDAKDLKNFLHAHKSAYVVGERVVYDKSHGISDFNKFILTKLKEYMSVNAIEKS